MAKKKTKEGLRVYVVVIGDLRQNHRYITYCPFIESGKPIGEKPLAVYLTRSRARQARKCILGECGHKAVHVIKLEKIK